jgi:hypothetical protein
MRRFFLVLVATSLACESGAQGTPANEGGGPSEVPGLESPSQIPEGFQELLRAPDGRYSKAGWNHYGPGYFDLNPDTGILTSHGGMGLFWYSVREYSDFILELEFRCASSETNSGVFLRVPAVPASDDYIYHSFEVQISDAGEGIHQTGAAYDAEPPTHLASLPPGGGHPDRGSPDPGAHTRG